MNSSDEQVNLDNVRADLADLKKTVEFHKELDNLQRDVQKELASIRKDFADLKTEVKVDKNFYRWIGASGLFVAIVLGALGISQWRDIFGKLEWKARETSDYQSNLAIGLSLVNGKRPQAAAPYLRQCYALTPGNEVVAGSLLWSYQEDDWDQAVPIANRLAADLGIDRIQDPWIINNIGLNLLYQGKQQEAKRYLTTASEKLHGDSEERDVWENLWVYYLFTGEISEAQDCLKKAVVAKSTKGERGVKEWEDELDWKLFQFLQKKNSSMTTNAKKTIAEVVK